MVAVSFSDVKAFLPKPIKKYSGGHIPLIICIMPDIFINYHKGVFDGNRNGSDACRILLTGNYDIVTIIDGHRIGPHLFVEVRP